METICNAMDKINSIKLYGFTNGIRITVLIEKLKTNTMNVKVHVFIFRTEEHEIFFNYYNQSVDCRLVGFSKPLHEIRHGESLEIETEDFLLEIDNIVELKVSPSK